MTDDRIAQLIHIAFADVVLGDGIGLWESQAIDDFADRATREKARQRDQRSSWSSLSLPDLKACSGCLFFSDAIGVRFLLPAYLLADVQGLRPTGPLYELSQIDSFWRHQYSALNSTQRLTVASYLHWCLQQRKYRPGQKHAFPAQYLQAALDQFWLDHTGQEL